MKAMDKKLGWLVCAAFLGLALLAGGCQPRPTAEPLPVKVDQEQVGPGVIGQQPMAGQRLELSPVIQITFDREMDAEKTGRAFSFIGPDRRLASFIHCGIFSKDSTA